MAHTVSLAAVLAVWHDANRWQLARPFLCDDRSVILGTVIHDNNFRLPASKISASKIIANFREAARKAAFFVVSGDNDGEFRDGRCTHPRDGSCAELGDGHPKRPRSGTKRQAKSDSRITRPSRLTIRRSSCCLAGPTGITRRPSSANCSRRGGRTKGAPAVARTASYGAS